MMILKAKRVVSTAREAETIVIRILLRFRYSKNNLVCYCFDFVTSITCICVIVSWCMNLSFL